MWCNKQLELRRGFVAGAAILIWLVSFSVRSEELGNAVSGFEVEFVRLTWQQIVKQVEAHPRLQAARNRMNGEKAQEQTAGALSNPSLQLSGAYGESMDGPNSRLEWGVAVDIPLDWAGRRQTRRNAAAASTQEAAAEMEQLRLDLLLTAYRHFQELLQAQAQVAVLEDLDAYMGNLLKLVRKRVAAGDTRVLDEAQALVEAEIVAGERVLSDMHLKGARATLAAFLGMGQGLVPVAVTDLYHIPSPITRQEISVYLLSTPPGTALATARIQSTAARLRQEQRNRIPRMSMAPFVDSELDRRALGIEVSVDLPLFDRNQGSIAKEKFLLSAAENDREAWIRDLEADLHFRQAICQGAADLAHRFSRRVLPAAIDTATSVEATYRAGEISLIEVLNARRTLLDIHLQLVAATARAQSECGELYVLTGKEVP